jgi:hypothetical protein
MIMEPSRLAGCLARNSQLAADGRVVTDCCRPFSTTHLPDQVTKAMSEICIRLLVDNLPASPLATRLSSYQSCWLSIFKFQQIVGAHNKFPSSVSNPTAVLHPNDDLDSQSDVTGHCWS